MKKLRAIFAGGGTGGHLTPALAIADRLKEKLSSHEGVEIRFVGTKRGIEYRLKDKLGYPLSTILVRGLSRAGIMQNLLFPVMLIAGIIKSIYLLLKFKTDIVIGTGGYVMGPVIMAAVAMNRFCVIQEQNSFPGLTTRQLASRVNRVFLGFGAAKQFLKGADESALIESGNPVKKIIGSVSADEGRAYFGFEQSDKVIFIFGGSQGATRINKNILRNLDKLPDRYSLIWQTGEGDYKEVAAIAGGRVSGRSLFSFTQEIEMAYAAADLVIARAGALTLAELEAAACPAILVPYPYATGDHQAKNAECFVAEGAAVKIDDASLDEVDLLGEAVAIAEDGRLGKMTEAIGHLRDRRKKPATDIIVEEILALTGFEEDRS